MKKAWTNAKPFLYYFFIKPNISRASSGVAISLPSSLAILTAFATSSPLDLALTPLERLSTL